MVLALLLVVLLVVVFNYCMPSLFSAIGPDLMISWSLGRLIPHTRYISYLICINLFPQSRASFRPFFQDNNIKRTLNQQISTRT